MVTPDEWIEMNVAWVFLLPGSQGGWHPCLSPAWPPGGNGKRRGWVGDRCMHTCLIYDTQ